MPVPGFEESTKEGAGNEVPEGRPSTIFGPGKVMIWADSPAADSTLQPGDVLISINGLSPGHPQLRRLDEDLTVGDTVHYEIDRDGERQLVSIQLHPRVESLTLLVTLMSSALTSLFFVGIGLMIFWLRPLDERALIIFLFFSAAALYYQVIILMGLDGLAFYRGILPTSWVSPIVILTLALYLVFLATGALLLNLALIFPRKSPFLQKHPGAWRWTYLLPVALALWWVFLSISVMMAGRPLGMTPYLILLGLALMFFGLRGLRGSGRRWIGALVDQPVRGFVLVCAAMLTAVMLPELLAYLSGTASGFLEERFGMDTESARGVLIFLSFLPTLLSGLVVILVPVLVYPFLLCRIVYRSYRAATREEKRQVRWPLWGLAIGVGGGVVVRLAFWVASIAVPVTQKSALFLVSWELSGKLLALVIPVSFAFAILKYRLMEIDVVIRKTILYTIVTGAVVLLYLGLVGGIGNFLISATGVESQTMTIVSTLMIALIFVPLRNSVQALIDRSFHRQKHELPELKRQLIHTLAEIQDPATILQTVVDAVQQALQLRSVVLFNSGSDGIYRPASKIGAREEVLRRIRFSEEGELLDSLSRSPRLPVRNVSEVLAKELERIEGELLIAIPHRGSIGHIYLLGRKLSDESFETAELDFVHDVGEQVLVLLDNLRLRDEESDFHKAAAIQRTLLPGEFPSFPRLRIAGTYRPSKMVSGDYYDVLRLSETRAAVSIGDVAGKGMPAALLMSSVQATVKALAREASSTGELCHRVRDVIVNMLSGGRFITFFYCILDEEQGRISWTNAGHNPPILLRRDGDVHRLEGGGPVFARLFRHQSFESCSLDLHAGDRLTLFTDGAVEVQNDDGDELGEPGLIELLQDAADVSIEALPGWLVARVTDYCNGQLSDDVTIVIAEIGEESLEPR